MKKHLIALQVYSVRDVAEKDFAGTVRKVKEMGYDGVELAGTYGMTAVEIKKILDETGLELVSAHVPMNQLEDDAVLDDFAATGMKYIAIPWFDEPGNQEELAATVERIRKVGERCKARGMQLLYHNHDFEFKKIGDKYILDSYYSEIPSDLLQTELDVCWVNVGGESKNMYGLIGGEEKKEDPSGKFEFRPVGYGLQDVPSIVAAADEAGSEWFVVEQDGPSMNRTSMECAEMSIRYLKSFL